MAVTAGSGSAVLPEVGDTEEFGATLAATLQAGDLVILDGPLGAGKTALARGIGAGLGVVGRVTSPTFVIARAHRSADPGRPGMVHVDAYRLGDGRDDDGSATAAILDELDALDLDTDLADSVVVVEWGAGVAERLAGRHLLVQMSREPESDVRTVTWRWAGD